MTALFWIAVIIGAACFVAVVIRDWREWEPPSTTRHTLDCLDFSTRGITDPDCIAPHPTNYFASPRAQVEFEDAFDGQLGIKP